MIPVDQKLGMARNTFSEAIVRIKNLRDLVERSLDEQVRTADAALVASQREAQLIEDFGYTQVGLPFRGVDMVTYFEDHRDRLGRDLIAGRAMVFERLMGAFDGFFARWSQECGLQAGKDGRAQAAAPGAINTALETLRLPWMLRQDAAQTLRELRGRRNVLIHRGGVADREYGDIIGQRDVVGNRLEVDAAYLDAAVEFIDRLAAALAIAADKKGPAHEGDKVNRERIVSGLLSANNERIAAGSAGLRPSRSV